MNTKVVIFDYDGTLTVTNKGGNSWADIWTEVNAKDIDDYYYQKYLNHEYTYKEWLSIVIKEWERLKVSSEMIDKISKKSKLVKDVDETLKILKDNNVSVYVLSGGVRNIAKNVLKDIFHYFKSVEAYELSFDEFGYVNGVIYPNHNPENKQEFINMVIKDENVEPNQVLFVGNGKNDETACLTGVNTLCFNPDGANYLDKSIWHNYIESESLKDILKFCI